MAMEASTLVIVTAMVGVAAITLLVWSLYPSPLPGIPYDPASRGRMLGDIPGFAAKAQLTKETSQTLFMLPERLGVPVAQFLSTRFVRPMVLVNDPREVEDVLSRRNREFDRAPFTARLFQPLLPHSTVAQMTTPALKAQKRLWADAMNAQFLRDAVAPNVRTAALELVTLWRLRARDAGGAPMSVLLDLNHAALDAIWIAVLGSPLGIVKRDIARLSQPVTSQGNQQREKVSKGEPESGSIASVEVLHEAAEHMKWMVSETLNSVWPRARMLYLTCMPKYRRLRRTLDQELQRLIRVSHERFKKSAFSDAKEGLGIQEACVMNLVLRRLALAEAKTGQPLTDPSADLSISQELLVFLSAGHESTAYSLSWFVKILAANQTAQDILRQKLQCAFPGPEMPTAAEILDANIPYLSAAIEDLLRMSVPNGLVTRQAVIDTQILGYAIPKGTDVLLNTRCLHRPPSVPEHVRSLTSQAASERNGHRGIEGESGEDLDVFEPGRWLGKDASGNECFNASALPSLQFGGGIRGCFGKKLAYQELSIFLVLLILNFKFLPLPEELRGMGAKEAAFRSPKICYINLSLL